MEMMIAFLLIELVMWGGSAWAVRAYPPVAEGEVEEEEPVEVPTDTKIVIMIAIPAVPGAVLLFLLGAGRGLAWHHVVMAIGFTVVCYISCFAAWTDIGRRLAKKKLF